MHVEAWNEWVSSSSSAIVIDGGQATEYERQGADLSRGTLWSTRLIVDSPSLVRDVTRAYLSAGSDIVSTVTYQATLEGIAENFHTDKERAIEIFQTGVNLVRLERDAFWTRIKTASNKCKPLVAGSLGSYGACKADGSEYSGHYKADFEDFHLSRARLAVDAGADILAFETVPSDAEAQGIVKMMTVRPELNEIPFYISFFCSDERRLGCGADVSTTIASLLRLNCASKNLVALGANCVPPALGKALVSILRSKIHGIMELLNPLDRWKVRTMFYPNSGEKWIPGTGWQEGSLEPNPRKWSQTVWAARPDIMGGCCRTTPEHIRRLREFM